MQKTEKKKTSTNPPPRWDGAAQLIAGNSEKTDAGGPSPQMTAPSRGWWALVAGCSGRGPLYGLPRENYSGWTLSGQLVTFSQDGLSPNQHWAGQREDTYWAICRLVAFIETPGTRSKLTAGGLHPPRKPCPSLGQPGGSQGQSLDYSCWHPNPGFLNMDSFSPLPAKPPPTHCEHWYQEV